MTQIGITRDANDGGRSDGTISVQGRPHRRRRTRISASFARRLSVLGVTVGLAARDVEKLKGLADETGGKTFAVDSADPSAVAKLFLDTERLLAEPDVVIYKASSRASGKLTDLDPSAVERCVAINAIGAFLVAQQAAKRMEPHGHGAILFTGATAGGKGSARSAPFAMGKFAVRGSFPRQGSRTAISISTRIAGE